jgi:hypothetical protein
MSVLTKEIKMADHNQAITTLQVLKRDNLTVVPFSRQKIKLALTKAFLSVAEQMQTLPKSIMNSIDSMTIAVTLSK